MPWPGVILTGRNKFLCLYFKGLIETGKAFLISEAKAQTLAVFWVAGR